jgi:hypothetical protein
MPGCQLPVQCSVWGVSVEVVPAIYEPKTRQWIYAGIGVEHPEEIGLLHYQNRGYEGCWCEGGTLNLLMKAACYPVLIKYNTFSDRQDARRRFFEAQCTILASRGSEILRAIRRAGFSEIEQAAAEILGDEFIQEYYPRVRTEFVCKLWKVLGAERLAEITRIFLTRPYDYRSGWPDLTLINDRQLRFVEVKTSDLLHRNQFRILETFGKPLGLKFSVAQIVASVGQPQITQALRLSPWR